MAAAAARRARGRRAGTPLTARRRLLLAVLGTLALAACTSDPTLPGSPARARASVPAASRFGLADSSGTHVSGLRYTPATVVVPAATVRAALVRVSADGAAYTFRSTTGPLASLARGRVMLLEGTALRVVTGVRAVGGTLLVQTAPAALTDAVAAGDLTWRTPLDFDSGVRSGARTGTSRGYRYTVALTPHGRRLAIDLRVGRSTPLAVDVHLRASLDRVTSVGHIVIASGGLRTATLGTADTAGRAAIRYAAHAVTELSSGGEQALTIPADFRVPVVVGGLPFSVQTSTSLVLAIGFGHPGDRVSGTATLRYSGSPQVQVSSTGQSSAAGVLAGAGAIGAGTIGARPLGAGAIGAGIPTGTVGLVLAATVARLALDVGNYGAAEAASLELDATASVRGTDGADRCDSRSVQLTGTASIQAPVFGLPGAPTPVHVLAVHADTADTDVPAGCGTVGGPVSR